MRWKKSKRKKWKSRSIEDCIVEREDREEEKKEPGGSWRVSPGEETELRRCVLCLIIVDHNTRSQQ